MPHSREWWHRLCEPQVLLVSACFCQMLSASCMWSSGRMPASAPASLPHNALAEMINLMQPAAPFAPLDPPTHRLAPLWMTSALLPNPRALLHTLYALVSIPCTLYSHPMRIPPALPPLRRRCLPPMAPPTGCAYSKPSCC